MSAKDDLENVSLGAAAGAATGAAAGVAVASAVAGAAHLSVVPVVGTAIGIVAGGLVGIIAGRSSIKSDSISQPLEPNQAELKALLEHLQQAIAAEATLPEAAKERARSQVAAIAEAARTPEDEESKSRARGAMETLAMMGTLLPPETPLVAILNALETAIAYSLSRHKP